MIDVLVAGGGPTGLSAAILAAQAGLRVVVVEPRQGVIDKACGEGLMPSAVKRLASLGVTPAPAFSLEGVCYVDAAGRTARARFQGRGLGVRRTVLHAALRDRAEAAGVEIVRGKVTGVEQDGESVCAAGLTARWLVAADGLHSSIRRAFGASEPPRHPPRWGVRRHFRTRPWSRYVEVHWADDCEAYVTPIDEDLVGVALLFRGKGTFDDWITRFPALAGRLGLPATRPMGAGPFEQRVARRTFGRVLLVGDAAGYLDPLTGEGVALGIATAEAAIDCLREGRPERYEAAWREATRAYFRLTGALLWAGSTPPLRRRIVTLARKAPFAFESAVRILADGALAIATPLWPFAGDRSAP